MVNQKGPVLGRTARLFCGHEQHRQSSEQTMASPVRLAECMIWKEDEGSASAPNGALFHERRGTLGIQWTFTYAYPHLPEIGEVGSSRKRV